MPNQYIVIYNENYLRSTQGDSFLSGIDDTTQIIADESDSEILHTYDSAIIGSAIYNTNQKRVHMLLYNPMIKNIYADVYMQSLTAQYNPPINLDRIDQEDYPLDNSYTYENDGSNVNVYLIDSGVQSTHQGLSGKVVTNIDFTDDNSSTSNANVDGTGHGTAVAGIIADDEFGVAKVVTLHSLKVFDVNDNIELSNVIDAINYILNIYNELTNNNEPAVVNMSLGASTHGVISNNPNDWDYPFLQAIENLSIAGITTVASSGNDYDDYCYIPALYPSVIAVGATAVNSNNRIWKDGPAGSNHGECVDIYAPGENIISNSTTTNNGSDNFTATSFAAPHVTGAIAMYLHNHPSATPDEVRIAIKNAATKNILHYGDSPYELLPESQNYFLNVSRLEGIELPDEYEDDDSLDEISIFDSSLESFQNRNFVDDNVDFVRRPGTGGFASRFTYLNFTNLEDNVDICVNKYRRDNGNFMERVCGINNEILKIK